MGPLQRTQRCRHGTACFLCTTAPGRKTCLRERFFACARKKRKRRAFRRSPLEASRSSRLKAKAAPAIGRSTASTPSAQANLGSGLIEFFLRVPDLKNLATDSQAGTFQVRPLLDAARLDTVHSLSGHITFEGAKTHVQAAILGDAVPGTPF